MNQKTLDKLWDWHWDICSLIADRGYMWVSEKFEPSKLSEFMRTLGKCNVWEDGDLLMPLLGELPEVLMSLEASNKARGGLLACGVGRFGHPKAKRRCKRG